MNRNFQNPKVQFGLRLFLAGLVLFLFGGNAILGSMLAAIVYMFFPVFYTSKNLMNALRTGTGDDDAEAALLEKIEKRFKKLGDELTKDKLTPEEVEKIVNKLNKDASKLTEEGMKSLKENLDKIHKEGQEALTKELNELKEALKTQSAEVKKLTDSGVDAAKNNKPFTFRQALKDAFMEKKEGVLSEVNDDYGKRFSLKGFFEKNGNQARTPVMTLKAPVDMHEGVIGFASGDTQNNNLRLTALDPNRVSIPLNIYPHVMDVYQVKSINKPYMALLVVYSYENGAAVKPEGVAAAKSSFKFKTVIFPAFFISTYFNLSDETLDDLDEAMDEIALVAPDKIMDAIDAMIDRTGGDDVNSIKGILHADKSTAYARQLPANSVDGAYLVDLIADMKLQCEKNRYKPNIVKLDPTALVALAAQKNSFDDSKTDRRVTYDTLGQPTAVCGLRIVQSNDIGVDAVLVLDNKQPWIGRRKDLTMEIGYNGTDLVEGQKTVIMKIRIAFGVRDKAAIIYCADAPTAIANLLK